MLSSNYFRIIALNLPSNLDPSVDLLINRLRLALSDDDHSGDDRVMALERELAEAREEVDRVLLHARQMQESLEQLLHDDQAKQSQLEELEQQVALLQRKQSESFARHTQLLEEELVKVKQQLQEKTVNLERSKQQCQENWEQELAKANQQLQEQTVNLEEAKQQCQENTVKLEEALEELEHYFLQSRQQSMMLLEYEKLQARASWLLLKTS